MRQKFKNNHGKLGNNYYSNRMAQSYKIFFYNCKILQNGQKFPEKISNSAVILIGSYMILMSERLYFYFFTLCSFDTLIVIFFFLIHIFENKIPKDILCKGKVWNG